MQNKTAYVIEALNRASDLTSNVWNALAGPDNPFVQHGFFTALEDSGSAASETGWMPCHLVLRQDGGPAEGLMPCYIKNHSYGEYVFDHSWADAYRRAGGEYYPKMQASVPFTPATGPRLLAKTQAQKQALLAGAKQFAEGEGISGLHLTFLQSEDAEACQASGLAMRTDQQFHWRNNQYGSFDDFLEALSSRKRKNIRKERRQALAADITIEQLSGADLTEAHWDAYFEFYVDTSNRKWGRPYLNREFFSLLGERLSERVLLVLAKREGRYIAGALNLIGADTLYGRYWGAIEHHPCLHFEVCYYQAIDYAIENGLACVEAGAQGEHKLARGYVPTQTRSAHWMVNAQFQAAVENYLSRERSSVAQDIDFLSNYTPFKKQG